MKNLTDLLHAEDLSTTIENQINRWIQCPSGAILTRQTESIFNTFMSHIQTYLENIKGQALEPISNLLLLLPPYPLTEPTHRFSIDIILLSQLIEKKPTLVIAKSLFKTDLSINFQNAAKKLNDSIKTIFSSISTSNSDNTIEFETSINIVDTRWKNLLITFYLWDKKSKESALNKASKAATIVEDILTIGKGLSFLNLNESDIESLEDVQSIFLDHIFKNENHLLIKKTAEKIIQLIKNNYLNSEDIEDKTPALMILIPRLALLAVIQSNTTSEHCPTPFKQLIEKHKQFLPITDTNIEQILSSIVRKTLNKPTTSIIQNKNLGVDKRTRTHKTTKKNICVKS